MSSEERRLAAPLQDTSRIQNSQDAGSAQPLPPCPLQCLSISFKCAGAALLSSCDQTTMNSPFFSQHHFFPTHPMAPVAPPNFLIPAFFPPPHVFPSFFPPPFGFPSSLPPDNFPAAFFPNGHDNFPEAFFPNGHDELQRIDPDDPAAAQEQLDRVPSETEASSVDQSTPEWAFILPPEFAAADDAPLQPAVPQKQKQAPRARSGADAAASELHRLLEELGLESQMLHMRSGTKSVTAALPNELPCGQGVLLLHRALDRELADKDTPLHRATYEKLKESIGRSVAHEIEGKICVKFFRSKSKVCVKATVSWQH